MLVVVNGTLTEAEQEFYTKQVTDKVPIGLIEKVYLDADGNDVAVSYELRKIQEKSKMGGYCIGTPEDWNVAKRAEQRDTIPNRII